MQDIYINDTYNHRIQKWASGGTSGVTVAGGNGYGSALNQLYYPHGFFVDDAGNIYVSDSRNNRILKFPAGSTSSTFGTVVAGGNGVGMGLDQLYNPYAVFVDKAGNIYVDDYGITNKHRVQLWKPLATSGITILEVSGSYSDYANANVWVDVNNGDIYVSDDANSRVMKYSVAGINYTFITPAVNTYSVVVTTFDGCMYRTSVNVDSLPIVKQITGIDSVCVGDSIRLVDSTIGGSWISTTTSTAVINNSGVLKAVSAGIDSIQYTINNGGCSASVTKAINVITNCNVNTSTIYHFCINKEHQCLNGNSFIFSNSSDTISGTNYSWDFGDGTTSTLDNPAKTYMAAGTYTVKLTADYNGVKYYTTQIVTVDPMPSINVSGGNCTGNVLSANATGVGIADIIWKQGTNVIKTDVPNWNPTGNLVAGGNGPETISNPNYYAFGYYTNKTDYPMGLYLDQQKVLYVVDKGMSRVERWIPGDSMGYVECTGMQNVGIVKDCKGNIYVTDDVNNLVKKWTPGATSGVTVAGGHGLGDSSNQLHDPRGNLIVDKDFNLYICDASLALRYKSNRINWLEFCSLKYCN